MVVSHCSGVGQRNQRKHKSWSIHVGAPGCNKGAFQVTAAIKPETDCERVLRLLITMGDTGLTAHHMEIGKGLRLSARIKDLREDGHQIETIDRGDKVCIYVLKVECLDVRAYRRATANDAYFVGLCAAGTTC